MGEKNLTVDQGLKIAEIKALLSISQELSKIHHEGINPEHSTDWRRSHVGQQRNGSECPRLIT